MGAIEVLFDSLDKLAGLKEGEQSEDAVAELKSQLPFAKTEAKTRLLPDGYRWPTYHGGELARVGDHYRDTYDDDRQVFKLHTVAFTQGPARVMAGISADGKEFDSADDCMLCECQDSQDDIDADFEKLKEKMIEYFGSARPEEVAEVIDKAERLMKRQGELADD